MPWARGSLALTGRPQPADTACEMSWRERVHPRRGSNSVVVAPNTWMRKRDRTVGAAAFAVLNAAAWVAILLGVLARPHLTLGQQAGFVAFFLGVAAASVALAVRLTRVGLWMGQDQVIVKGPTWTWRLALSDVER